MRQSSSAVLLSGLHLSGDDKLQPGGEGRSISFPVWRSGGRNHKVMCSLAALAAYQGQAYGHTCKGLDPGPYLMLHIAQRIVEAAGSARTLRLFGAWPGGFFLCFLPRWTGLISICPGHGRSRYGLSDDIVFLGVGPIAYGTCAPLQRIPA